MILANRIYFRLILGLGPLLCLPTMMLRLLVGYTLGSLLKMIVIMMSLPLILGSLAELAVLCHVGSKPELATSQQ